MEVLNNGGPEKKEVLNYRGRILSARFAPSRPTCAVATDSPLITKVANPLAGLEMVRTA